MRVAEKVSSLGKNWHRPCLRCERCSKTLAPGSHAEVPARPLTLNTPYEILLFVETVVAPFGGKTFSFHVQLFLWQHDGQPYCHKPCYAVLFGPKGMKEDAGEKYILLHI